MNDPTDRKLDNFRTYGITKPPLIKDSFTFDTSQFTPQNNCILVLGPLPVIMRLNSLNGQQYYVKRDIYYFKVTIQNGHSSTINNILSTISSLPLLYLAALEIVSVGSRTTDGSLKDGLEIYYSIGSLENSGRDYLNVSNHNTEPLLYQLGHVIEQEISFAETPDPKPTEYPPSAIYQIFSGYWYNNFLEDAISVSRHGYMKPIDDILEFSKYYAFCTQTMNYPHYQT